MQKVIWRFLISCIYILSLSSPTYAIFDHRLITCSCAPVSTPGGDHPDDTFAVDAGVRPYRPILTSDPDIVVLGKGNYDDFRNIASYFKKSVSISDLSSSVDYLLTSSQSLIIPSGGLYGMENSEFFEATLDEYVRQGGTLIVFAQQRGYEYNILPTPDGNPITGYGWAEDQACFTNGVYIDTWHQVLSGQNLA